MATVIFHKDKKKNATSVALLIYSVFIQQVRVEAFTFTMQLVNLKVSRLVSGQK